jgi:uncharacterized protein YwgA
MSVSEELETMKLGFLLNFISEHLEDKYEEWLVIENYSEKDGKTLEIVSEFIVDMQLEESYRDWLIITYRKEKGNKPTDEIMKFVEQMKVEA